MPDLHRDVYPEQYSHPMVSKWVAVIINGHVQKTGRIKRVVQGRFGALAIFENHREAWSLRDCHVTEDI